MSQITRHFPCDICLEPGTDFTETDDGQLCDECLKKHFLAQAEKNVEDVPMGERINYDIADGVILTAEDDPALASETPFKLDAKDFYEARTPEQIVAELMRIDPGHPTEKVLLYGQIKWVHGLYYDVEVISGDRSKEIRLLQASTKYERDSYDTALIEIPKGFVTALGLAAFVLDDSQIEKYRKRIAEYNAPKLPNTSTKKPERVGNICI